MGFRTLLIRAVTSLAFVGLLCAATAKAETVQEFFKTNCGGCHTIGAGKLVGPDLKNVSERQDREWLVKFIMDPTGVLASGDKYANDLKAKYNNVPMANVAGVNEKLVNEILDYIAEESKKESVATAPLVAVTDADVTLGRMLFLGQKKLKNGGLACVSCHEVNNAGFAGGTFSGKNLTEAFGGDRAAMVAWLSKPSGKTMSVLFADRELTETERLQLSAFFESTKTAPVGSGLPVLMMAFLALVGAAIFLGIFGAIWKNRFQSVREKLVNEATGGRA